jgi:hypothetical protein
MAEGRQQGKDYYEVLGVGRKASADEIRQAWKKRAREWHPDRNQGDPEVAARFREAKEAYNVLRDPEKRARYDRGEPVSGERGGQPRAPEVDFSSAFSDFFSSFFGSFGNRRARDVYLPENDLGLLRALIMAELSSEDGQWEVRRAATEERGFVPEVLYRVVRRNDKLYIYRRVVDWMNPKDRENPEVGVKIKRESGHEEKAREIFLEPYFLYGEGRDSLENVSIPRGYGRYLAKLYEVAQAYAGVYREGGAGGSAWQLNEAIIELNAACVIMSNLRSEGDTFYPDEEVLRIIPMSNFDAELQRAGRLVRRVERARRGPEGQTSAREGGPGGRSGSAEEKG